MAWEIRKAPDAHVRQALYAELPVVTTAMSGPLEIVDASCDILVPASNVDALAAALTELIHNSELRLRLGTNGPARARRLSDPVTQMVKARDGVPEDWGALFEQTHGTGLQHYRARQQPVRAGCSLI